MKNVNIYECKLTDVELAEKIDSINSKLCDTGGRSWSLSVPPDYNKDPDILITELIRRFYNKMEQIDELKKERDNWEMAFQDLKESWNAWENRE